MTCTNTSGVAKRGGMGGPPQAARARRQHFEGVKLEIIIIKS